MVDRGKKHSVRESTLACIDLPEVWAENVNQGVAKGSFDVACLLLNCNNLSMLLSKPEHAESGGDICT